MKLNSNSAFNLLGWLNLTNFIIAFAVTMLISMGVAFIIIRKTE